MPYSKQVVLNITTDRANANTAFLTKWKYKGNNETDYAFVDLDVTANDWCRDQHIPELAALTNGARLYIVGHCTPGGEKMYRTVQAQDGIYWYELAKFLALNLTDQSLKTVGNQQLMISLVSCHAARGWKANSGLGLDLAVVEESFALRFHAALGYYRLAANVHARALTTWFWPQTGTKGVKITVGISQQKMAEFAGVQGSPFGSKYLIHWTAEEKQRFSNKEVDLKYALKHAPVDVVALAIDDIKTAVLDATDLDDPQALITAIEGKTTETGVEDFIRDVETNRSSKLAGLDPDEQGELIDELKDALAGARNTRDKRVFPAEEKTLPFVFGQKPVGMP